MKGTESDWQLYTGPVRLPEDSRLEAKAIRYGFKESEATLLAPYE